MTSRIHVHPASVGRPDPALGVELAAATSYPTGVSLVTWDRPGWVFLPCAPGRGDWTWTWVRRRYLWDEAAARAANDRLLARIARAP